MTLKQHLQRFVSARCYRVPGARTPLSRFLDEFILHFLPASEREHTSRRDVIEALDTLDIQRGNATGNQVALINVAMPFFRDAIRPDGRVYRVPLGKVSQ